MVFKNENKADEFNFEQIMFGNISCDFSHFNQMETALELNFTRQTNGVKQSNGVIFL